MSPHRRVASGGGCLIFIGFLLGAFIGFVRGEPSLGVIIGVGVSVALAVILWLVERRRA